MKSGQRQEGPKAHTLMKEAAMRFEMNWILWLKDASSFLSIVRVAHRPFPECLASSRTTTIATSSQFPCGTPEYEKCTAPQRIVLCVLFYTLSLRTFCLSLSLSFFLSLSLSLTLHSRHWCMWVSVTQLLSLCKIFSTATYTVVCCLTWFICLALNWRNGKREGKKRKTGKKTEMDLSWCRPCAGEFICVLAHSLPSVIKRRCITSEKCSAYPAECKERERERERERTKSRSCMIHTHTSHIRLPK